MEIVSIDQGHFDPVVAGQPSGATKAGEAASYDHHMFSSPVCVHGVSLILNAHVLRRLAAGQATCSRRSIVVITVPSAVPTDCSRLPSTRLEWYSLTLRRIEVSDVLSSRWAARWLQLR